MKHPWGKMRANYKCEPGLWAKVGKDLTKVIQSQLPARQTGGVKATCMSPVNLQCP